MTDMSLIPTDPAKWTVDDHAVILTTFVEDAERPFDVRWQEAVKVRANGSTKVALEGVKLARHFWKQSRLDAGLTLRQLGSQIGVHAGALSRWENGGRTPTGDAGMAYKAFVEGEEDRWVEYARAWLASYREWVAAGRPDPFSDFASKTRHAATVEAYTGRDS